MSWADVLAVQALIQTIPALAASTYVTQLDKPATGQPPTALPYVVIHPLGGTDTQSRFSGPYATEHPEFTLHIVGVSANQVRVLADLLKAVIKPNGVGIVPTVSGRRNQRMYWRQPLPIQTDNSVTPPIVFDVVEVGWVSDPS